MQKCLYRACLIVVASVLFASCGKKVAIDSYALIPQPVEMTVESGTFSLASSTKCYAGNMGQNDPVIKFISTRLRHWHFNPVLVGKPEANCLQFLVNEEYLDELGDEGYQIDVDKSGVVVSANTERGLFYGFQTFVQMLPEDVATTRYSKIDLPYCHIKDYPRFEWRGCHLDVSRHFFGVSQVKKILDVMALYKMNKFHWHLTDDHGWRVQIDQYPELTRVGAWRPERTSWDTLHPVMPEEPMTYGGFYTKEQIRDIVRYAAARHIDIIPEIEIPGHCSAILAAYPQYACDNYPYTVAVGPYWPPKAIMCAGNDGVLTFYKNVLTEVAELFPYPLIHIGGDEAFNDNWQVCPKCQQRIQDKGLRNELELQQWLMNQIEHHLDSLGKKAIIWDDIVSDDMVNTSTIMCWQGLDVAKTAAKHGNDVIMCPTTHCYFNYYQSKDKDERLCMEGYVSLGKAYSFDPMPEGLSEAQQKHILGGQCNLWTEFVNDPETAEYMIMPRLFALSECVWSPKEKKDPKKFATKVDFERNLMKKLGYRPSNRTVMELE